MQTDNESVSRLMPIGAGYFNNRCGYCKGRSTSFSYYANAVSLTPEFYKKLLDRGWRRSGTTLYKPDLHSSCCPHYTIRLDAFQYKPTKDQRQTQNRFTRYVLGDPYTKAAARIYPRSREQAKKRKTEFDLLDRVHESEISHLGTPPEPAHAFAVTMESNDFTEEKYALFENYQRKVHREPPRSITKKGFKSFLCSSPLRKLEETIDGSGRLLGSYHQCYRLDGKLVAVGVLDLLPQCVSAVYFMYHETVSEYHFGKLSAMREIGLAKEMGYRWWYAGFYIHNCVKMKYKADFRPQTVLDPESYEWDPLTDEVKKEMDEKKYISLSRERRGDGDVPPPQVAETEAIETDNKSGKAENSDTDSDDELSIDPTIPVYLQSMPGVLTIDQLINEADLDNVTIEVHGITTEASNLVSWESGNLNKATSAKSIVAGLVATIGVALAKEVVVKLG